MWFYCSFDLKIFPKSLNTNLIVQKMSWNIFPFTQPPLLFWRLPPPPPENGLAAVLKYFKLTCVPFNTYFRLKRIFKQWLICSYFFLFLDVFVSFLYFLIPFFLLFCAHLFILSVNRGCCIIYFSLFCLVSWNYWM